MIKGRWRKMPEEIITKIKETIEKHSLYSVSGIYRVLIKNKVIQEGDFYETALRDFIQAEKRKRNIDEIKQKYSQLNSLMHYLKWECLRRKQEYIEDCKKWAKKRKVDWKNDIILGYKFKNTEFFNKPVEEWSNKDIEEWSRLGRQLRKVKYPRQLETGDRPTYGCFHGWYKCHKKHLINIPLNPNYSPAQLPFFVSLKGKPAMREANISEIVAPGCEIIRTSPLKAIFEINFKYPKGYLVDLFSIIVAAKKEQQLKIIVISREGQVKEAQEGEDIDKKDRDSIIVKITPIKKNHYIGLFEIDFTCTSTKLLDKFREKINKYGVKGLTRYNALKKRMDLYRNVYDLAEKGQKYMPIAIRTWKNKEIDTLQGQGKYAAEEDKKLFYKFDKIRCDKIRYGDKYIRKVYKITKQLKRYMEKEFDFL